MKIKTNDKVCVVAGRDSGKTGKVTKVLPTIGRVVVEGVNMVAKHIKSGRTTGKGQKITKAMPMDVSNIVLICPQCNKNTRVGYTILKDGKKYRSCKKCKQVIDTQGKDK